MVAQHYISIGPMYCVTWVVAFLATEGEKCHPYSNPANTKHLYNICTMLDQRRRRWAVVVQMLYKCFVFAGNAAVLPRSMMRWAGVEVVFGQCRRRLTGIEPAN